MQVRQLAHGSADILVRTLDPGTGPRGQGCPRSLGQRRNGLTSNRCESLPALAWQKACNTPTPGSGIRQSIGQLRISMKPTPVIGKTECASKSAQRIHPTDGRADPRILSSSLVNSPMSRPQQPKKSLQQSRISLPQLIPWILSSHPWVGSAIRGSALPSVGQPCHPWGGAAIRGEIGIARSTPGSEAVVAS